MSLRIYSRYYLILFFAIFQSCTSLKKYNYNVTERKYAPEALKKDFSVIRSSLQEAHPGLYWYISKKALDAKFDSVYKSLDDSLTMMQFYKRAAPVVAQVRCGHTRLFMRAQKMSKKELKLEKRKGKNLFSQLEYRVENGKLYVIRNHSDNKLLKPGDELVAINDKPIGPVLDTAKKLFSSDGYNTTYFDRGLEKTAFGWYRLFNKKSDTLRLQVRDSVQLKEVLYVRKAVDKSGEADTLKNKTVSNKKQVNPQPVIKEKKLKRYVGRDEFGNAMLQLSYTGKDSATAVLKVRSFSFAHANHSKFYRESFADIKKHGVKNLVLDLRYNGGGSLEACRNLFAYFTGKPYTYLGEAHAKKRFYHAPMDPMFKLAFFLRSLIIYKKADSDYHVNIRGNKELKPKENHYDGKLAVLINGYTFSASTLLSANLKKNNRAVFVGEETGGGFNKCSAGQLPLVKLPNTKLILRLPLFSLSPNASTPVQGHGIYPDYAILPKVADLGKGQDPELDKAVEVLALPSLRISH